jgi:hypothetical protein
MAAKITAAFLEARGACAGQVAQFRELFGEETTVTVAKARRFYHLFQWVWASSLLSNEGQRAFLLEVRPDWDAYLAAIDADLQIYKRSLLAPHSLANKRARTAYEEAVKPHAATYNRAQSAAWARAWIEDHK